MSRTGPVVRPLTPADLDAALDLWRRSGIVLTLSDRREELQRVLDRNPDTCLGAFAGGALVGAVLGTFDGRRGNVWHLAVSPERQREGIGRVLMGDLEARWRKLGVVKVTFTVEASNRKVEAFYHRLGYHSREDIFPMSKILRED